MSLSVGIVGLPNVGVVAVPDESLEKLAWVVAGRDSIAALQNDESKEWLNHLPPEVPAMVNFIDIAGHEFISRGY